MGSDATVGVFDHDRFLTDIVPPVRHFTAADAAAESHTEIRLAATSPMGYGLFDPALVAVDEALQRFADLI